MEFLKKHKNKIIIFLLFLVITLLILHFKKGDNEKILNENDAKNKISELFGDDVEKIEDEAMMLANNSNFSIFVVNDNYIVLDTTKKPIKIYHYRSKKKDIAVEVLEINENGYRVKHDDHEHYIEGKVPKGTKVGDTIYIKDPHTHLERKN